MDPTHRAQNGYYPAQPGQPPYGADPAQVVEQDDDLYDLYTDDSAQVVEKDGDLYADNSNSLLFYYIDANGDSRMRLDYPISPGAKIHLLSKEQNEILNQLRYVNRTSNIFGST